MPGTQSATFIVLVAELAFSLFFAHLSFLEIFLFLRSSLWLLIRVTRMKGRFLMFIRSGFQQFSVFGCTSRMRRKELTSSHFCLSRPSVLF